MMAKELIESQDSARKAAGERDVKTNELVQVRRSHELSTQGLMK